MQINTPNRQAAFSLLEVLIALLILAIGMLSFAASEIMGQRGTHSALKRSQATILASDLAERIHANPLGDYTTAIDCDNLDNRCVKTSTQAALECDADEMAEYDLAEWYCRGSYRNGVLGLLGGPGRPGLEQELPGASASIRCTDADTEDQYTCSPGSTYFITMTWGERDPNRAMDGPANNRHDDIKEKSMEIVIVP
jgi:type IV pilus assembly protein PilV